MEAMSFGAPVIVSNRASLPEVVSSSDQIFDPDSKDSFVELLERVLRDDDLAAEYSHMGWNDLRNFPGNDLRTLL